MNIDKIVDDLFVIIGTFTEFTPIGERKRKFREYLESLKIIHSAELKYNSIFDEAYEMASTLNEIDDELIKAAQHTSEYNGKYSGDWLLANLCRIMYKSMGYHKQDKYNK